MSQPATPSISPAHRRRPFWVPVVTGLVRRGPEVLVGLRPPGHALAGYWEFPGGKIERGETPEIALARELSEELGILVQVGKLRFASTHVYEDMGVVMLFYEVLYWKGELRAQHHTELRWIQPTELTSLSLPEANQRVASQLIRILEGQ